WPLVPVEPEPAKNVNGCRGRPRLDGGPAKILDAEDDPPAALAGQEPVGEEGAGIAEVQGACGRGGQSGDFGAGAGRSGAGRVVEIGRGHGRYGRLAIRRTGRDRWPS